MNSGDEHMDELYSNIGNFIITHERIMTILKLIIFKNYVTGVSKGFELETYKIIIAFEKQIEANYTVSMEKHRENFKMLIKRLIQANRLRNKYLHAQVQLSAWLPEEEKKGVPFDFQVNKLFSNGDLISEKFKIGSDTIKAHATGLEILFNELTQINFVTRGIVSFNYNNTATDIFEKFDFEKIRMLNFKLKN